MLFDTRFHDDLARYPARPWLREQSIWAVAVMRFGQRNDQRPTGLLRRVLDRVYWLAFRVVETATGITLPKSTRIGGGLRIHHFGCVIVHPDAVLGRNCTLRQGNTIGNRRPGGPVPQLGNGVELGAYAQVLGDVKVGDNALIGAMSVVLHDVPPGATAVGSPARVIERTAVASDSAAAGGTPSASK
jgi:serine O-acetyltransferase